MENMEEILYGKRDLRGQLLDPNDPKTIKYQKQCAEKDKKEAWVHWQDLEFIKPTTMPENYCKVTVEDDEE